MQDHETIFMRRGGPRKRRAIASDVSKRSDYWLLQMDAKNQWVRLEIALPHGGRQTLAIGCKNHFPYSG
jgi:hypothetical protein